MEFFIILWKHSEIQVLPYLLKVNFLKDSQHIYVSDCNEYWHKQEYTILKLWNPAQSIHWSSPEKWQSWPHCSKTKIELIYYEKGLLCLKVGKNIQPPMSTVKFTGKGPYIFFNANDHERYLTALPRVRPQWTKQKLVAYRR